MNSTPTPATAPAPRRFVALDRDGTLIAERHYLSDPAGVELLPNALEGLRRLSDLGLGLVIVTNQSGIGRRYFDLPTLAAIHTRLTTLLAEGGVTLQGIYYCPHTPDDRCDCRKPRPGLLQAAAADHGFRPADSFVIGDNVCDIELGRAVGATTLLVRTGYGSTLASGAGAAPPDFHPDFIVDDLWAAAEVIERQIARRQADAPTPE